MCVCGRRWLRRRSLLPNDGVEVDGQAGGAVVVMDGLEVSGSRSATEDSRTDGQLSVSRDDAMLTRLDAAWDKEKGKKRQI